MRFAHIGVIHPHSSGWRGCLQQMPEADPVAYYDADSNVSRERLPESERAKPLYDDVAALLRKEQPEAAMVTLPNDATPAVIVQVAQAGCHVFAEKTCARTAPEFQPAADAVRQAGVQFGTGYLRRFSPVGVAIKEMVDQGLRGTLGWVRWERSGLELEARSVHPSWAAAPTRVLHFTPHDNAGYGAGTGRIAIKRMVAAARGNGPPAFATDDALRVLEVLDAAHQSDASGRHISITGRNASQVRRGIERKL